MDFGIGQIVNARSLCHQIYDRCNASKGEFKALSTQALDIRVLLKTIENTWRREGLSQEQYESLKGRISSLSGLLQTVCSRLNRYSSLGTKSQSLQDRLRWAMDGGATQVCNQLEDQKRALSNFYIIVKLQSGIGTRTFPPQSPDLYPNIDVPKDLQQLSDSSMPTPEELPTPVTQTHLEPGGYSIGVHSMVDGPVFLIMSTLTLLSFALILTIGGFYTLCLILFPFAEISTLFKQRREHWNRLNAFYGYLFKKTFRFATGLWD